MNASSIHPSIGVYSNPAVEELRKTGPKPYSEAPK